MRHNILRVGISALIATIFFAVPASADTVRAAVGEPLVAAQKLASVHDYKTAMAKIEQADAAPNKTQEEQQLIAQMRTYVNAMSVGPDKLKLNSR